MFPNFKIKIFFKAIFQILKIFKLNFKYQIFKFLNNLKKMYQFY